MSEPVSSSVPPGPAGQDELTTVLADLEQEPLAARAAGFIQLHDQLAERLAGGPDSAAIA